MRQLDPNSNTPAVHQIIDAIRDAIRDGELQPGDMLPSRADLARHFGVAQATIKSATDKASDILVGRQGRGIFVRTDAVQAARGHNTNHILRPDRVADLANRVARIEAHLGLSLQEQQ